MLPNTYLVSNQPCEGCLNSPSALVFNRLNHISPFIMRYVCILFGFYNVGDFILSVLFFPKEMKYVSM
jgi:hypothetical protein